MQDTIPISVDDRKFTIWNWLGFLFLFAFMTLHFAAIFTGVILEEIWGNILSGDYTETELFLAVGWTVIAAPAILYFYGLFFSSICEEPGFSRRAVLLDTRENQLLLKMRHITGRVDQKALPLADIRGVTIEWSRDDDGRDVPKTRILTKGKPVTLIVTNLGDASDADAFVERFRAHLAAFGWKGDQA